MLVGELRMIEYNCIPTSLFCFEQNICAFNEGAALTMVVKDRARPKEEENKRCKGAAITE